MKHTVELEQYLPLNPNYKSILILDRKLTEEKNSAFIDEIG